MSTVLFGRPWDYSLFYAGYFHFVLFKLFGDMRSIMLRPCIVPPAVPGARNVGPVVRDQKASTEVNRQLTTQVCPTTVAPTGWSCVVENCGDLWSLPSLVGSGGPVRAVETCGDLGPGCGER